MSFKISEDYLLNHAYTNVWCTPDQDKQGNFQLPRITPQNGVWTNFTYQWRKIGLPVKKARFHVYHIGQVHPSILGLVNKRGVWIPVANAMQDEAAVIQIYNGRGTVVPRCLCWYIVTGDNNLLLAVRKSEQRVDLTGIDMEDEPLFMRLYSNAYFHRLDVSVRPGIRVLSKRCNSNAEISALKQEAAAWPQVGMTICYVNGKVVDRIDSINATAGDYVDIIQDASIKHVIEYEVATLREFNSALDSMRKYLLTHDSDTDTIDYFDDADLFLVTPRPGNRWVGTYLHRNDSRTMRQLTHRDYAVAVPRVAGAAASNPHLKDKPLTLRLVVRNSGYNRPLVLENSRLFELYKLSAQDRLDAMLGSNALVSVWRAEALEQSEYVKLMGAENGEITREMVQKAYGYNALSVLLGNTPVLTTMVSGQNVVFIPPASQGNATVYEYSRDGLLLDYNTITLDNTYTARQSDTRIGEVVFGVASTTLDIQTTASGVIDPNLNYRFYEAPAVGGIKTGDWVDVTGQPKYLVQNGTYQWVSTANRVVRVVSNKSFLGYSTKVSANAGVVEFDIVHQTSLGLEKFDVALGRLNIFVNGYSLIEKLDYVVKGSRVVITCKEYFKRDESGEEDITIRFMSFANADLSRDVPDDAGFVYNDTISANSVFNIRDDRVLRIVVKGRLRLRSDIKFAEDGIAYLPDGVENGHPYMVEDIIVPMNRYLTADAGCEDHTRHMRQLSKAIDKEVSDYMTIKHPQEPDDKVNAVAGRHILYSPFLARIVSDLQTGVLWEQKFIEHYGDDYVREVAQPYEYLLDFDPAGGKIPVDHHFVVIHPHIEPTYESLGIYQWRMFQRIAKLYAPSVDLSSTMQVLQF